MLKDIETLRHIGKFTLKVHKTQKFTPKPYTNHKHKSGIIWNINLCVWE